MRGGREKRDGERGGEGNLDHHRPSQCLQYKQWKGVCKQLVFVTYGGSMDRVGISLVPAIQKVNNHQLNILPSSQDYWGKPEQAPHALDCIQSRNFPLLAHGLTVKFSPCPCPCSHSSLAGQIVACLCGHFKCNLLLRLTPGCNIFL